MPLPTATDTALVSVMENALLRQSTLVDLSVVFRSASVPKVVHPTSTPTFHFPLVQLF